MESIQNSMYNCLYNSASIYTQCSSVCEKITYAGKNIIHRGYQYVAPYVETVAVYMEIQIPLWLQSEKTQEEWREISSNLIKEYPWIRVYSTYTKWYKETCKHLDDPSNDEQGSLRFILFRILKDVDNTENGESRESIDNRIIYRRFNTIDDAESWWVSCERTYTTAKQDILHDYVEEHPFIQLTPRNRNIDYDWREKIRSFSVKNNMILDKDFIEWCLDSEEHTIDDHYPLEYIDSNINIGQLESMNHVIVGEGVKTHT